MDTKAKNGTSCHEHGAECAEVPELKRLRYFYGQMLGVHDFQTEQSYFREKLKLHNRCLHGYGVVCGLMVVPEPRADGCIPKTDSDREQEEAKLKELLDRIAATQKNIDELEKKQQTGGGENAPTSGIDEQIGNEKKKLAELKAQAEAQRRKLDEMPPADPCHEEEPTRVRIECGLALDCEGNEIVVRRPLGVDLWQHLSPEDRDRVAGGAHTLYLSICYCEQPVDPVRPVLQDACGASMECTYGKIRDAVKIRVTLDAPEADTRCETCCEPCRDACLLLARIDRFRKGTPLAPKDIDNSVRRLIGPYTAATITGISWAHGAVYSEAEAGEILGARRKTKGLRVTFSRPVLTSTLEPGVVDIWVLQGGDTRSGDMYHLGGEFVDLDPNQKTTTEFRYRYSGREDLDAGDRVLITIRCAFILDECCRPVDGVHVGGRVPILPDEEFKRFARAREFAHCATRPPGYNPLWTSGAGAPGVSFESWFYVEDKDSEKEIDQ